MQFPVPSYVQQAGWGFPMLSLIMSITSQTITPCTEVLQPLYYLCSGCIFVCTSSLSVLRLIYFLRTSLGYRKLNSYTISLPQIRLFIDKSNLGSFIKICYDFFIFFPSICQRLYSVLTHTYTMPIATSD